jgi:hypothetical protein
MMPIFIIVPPDVAAKIFMSVVALLVGREISSSARYSGNILEQEYMYERSANGKTDEMQLIPC